MMAWPWWRGKWNISQLTPQKQVYFNEPIVSYDQLGVYSNIPNSLESVCSLSSAMVQSCIMPIRGNHPDASTSSCAYASCPTVLMPVVLNRVCCMEMSIFCDGAIVYYANWREIIPTHYSNCAYTGCPTMLMLVVFNRVHCIKSLSSTMAQSWFTCLNALSNLFLESCYPLGCHKNSSCNLFSLLYPTLLWTKRHQWRKPPSQSG